VFAGAGAVLSYFGFIHGMASLGGGAVSMMKTASPPRISPAKHRKRKQTSDHILRHGTPVEAPSPRSNQRQDPGAGCPLQRVRK
jgi:hypothetical protein